MGQENGNGEGKLDLAKKTKYMRMDMELPQDEQNAELQQPRKSSESKRYVFACAVFASLNSVLLGYGNTYDFALSWWWMGCSIILMRAVMVNGFFPDDLPC